MFSVSYKRYVLGIITLVCTLNYIDRGLILILLQPIKDDLQLTDTQLGFLTGIAFSLFYATLGLPVARYADRGNRVTITSIAIGLWGVTVMLCMTVTTFVQLVCARIAAAVGESGCMPPTYSILGDYFPAPADRTRAMALYWMSSPMAALISFAIGGHLNERFGWRSTFFLMGIPALILSVVVKMTVIEPRTRHLKVKAQFEPQPGLTSMVKMLWRQKSSRYLILTITLLWMQGAGLGSWEAAFLMRSHRMGTAEVGVWLGLVYGISGVTGILCGGYAASRWFAEDERGQIRLSAVMIALQVPCYILFLLIPDKHYALMALIPSLVVCNFFYGPTFAVMQRLVPDQMRATTMSVVMLLANIVGMGIGPQLIGILSDALMPRFGANSLRYSMVLMSLVALWTARCCWRVGRTVMADLASVTSRPHSDTERTSMTGGNLKAAHID